MSLAQDDRVLIDGTFTVASHETLGAAIEVHRTLGPGLLESTYSQCLKFELNARKLRYVSQHSIPIVYKGMALESNYRVDLIVEDYVVVEVKSVSAILPVHHAQLLTYMKLTGCPAGLLINFSEARLMDGVKRLLNTRTGVSLRLLRTRRMHLDVPVFTKAAALGTGYSHFSPAR